MRNLIIAFVFGLMLAGCYDMHGRVGRAYVEDFVDPVMPTGDAGPVVSPADGGVPMPTTDAGSIEPDSGLVVVADAGPPPEPDAGSEPDSGPAVDAGPLLIEAGLMPPSDILIGGDSRWRSVASYEVVRDGVESVFVMIDGFAEDTSQVAIAHYDATLGTEVIIGRTVLPSGENSGSTIILDAPLETGDAFEIWVMIPPVVSNLVSGSDHDHFPMSGDTFRMGVNGVTRAGMFSVIPPLYGNEFVIRRTRLTISPTPSSSVALSNGTEQDLYGIQVSADVAGEGALHQVQYTIVAPFPTALTLSNFRHRRGSSIDLDSVIVDEDGNNLSTGSLVFTGGDSHIVTVVHLNEDYIIGSGNVYTLLAVPSGVDTGESISITLHRTEDGTTGYLMDSYFAIDASPLGAAGTTPPRTAGFIWSDVSEIPHSDYYGCCSGSRDWMDGALLIGFDRVRTLSR